MDCNPMASLSITNSWTLLRLMSIELVMPSNNLILCHPLLLLPSIFPSIRVFSNESAFRSSWPKYWSFSFSISPSNEYSGPISFRMDWLDHLAVQRTLRSLLQQHSLGQIKADGSCMYRELNLHQKEWGGGLAGMVIKWGRQTGWEDSETQPQSAEEPVSPHPLPPPTSQPQPPAYLKKKKKLLGIYEVSGD